MKGMRKLMLLILRRAFSHYSWNSFAAERKWEIWAARSKKLVAWSLIKDAGGPGWLPSSCSVFLNVYAIWRWESCWDLSCSWESKLLDREIPAYYRGACHLCQGNSASKVIGICFQFCGWAKEISIGLKSVWTDCDGDVLVCVCSQEKL